jgi:glycerophosphoryl diester phosphodiesterase
VIDASFLHVFVVPRPVAAGRFCDHHGVRLLPPAAPLLIAHRGASGIRPEHTLAGYELAARMGADYLEPDLVATSDGVLVARHEPEIGGTTDIAEHPELADRHTTKIIDGERVSGWFVEDLTLAELRSLRARERIPLLRPRNTFFDRRYPVPTFDEILALRARLSTELGREIGVYPETKHPTYFASLGSPLEPPLVAALNRAGLNRPDAPVFVQSFETGNLRALREVLRVPLVQLLHVEGAPADLVAAGDPRGYADLVAPDGLAGIAGYADAIGPQKDQVIARAADQSLAEPTGLVEEAHAAGLQVHAYTFRNENQFLPTNLRSGGVESDHGDSAAEYAAFFATGLDGVFTDHTDAAFAARARGPDLTPAGRSSAVRG